MSRPRAHAWDLTPKEAVQLQRDWAPRVIVEDRIGPVRRVAGVDVGFEDGGAVTRAAVAVLDFPSLTLIEQSVFRQPTRFPYVPGLLSFREIPALTAALDALSRAPDLILCDGQGYAHPRRFGIACHLGVLRDLPTIGVGKTRLVGEYGAVPEQRGAWTPLTHKDEVVGAVLRTREGVKPIYVSLGHRLSLQTALRWTMACTPRFRLPETTRQAHRLASSR
jgi:deoxyribonuclease V